MDQARLPTSTLAEPVELLAHGRGIALDPDVLLKSTAEIASAIADPCLREP